MTDYLELPAPVPTRMGIEERGEPLATTSRIGGIESIRSLQPCWWKRVSAVGFLFVVELRPDPALWGH